MMAGCPPVRMRCGPGLQVSGAACPPDCQASPVSPDWRQRTALAAPRDEGGWVLQLEGGTRVIFASLNQLSLVDGARENREQAAEAELLCTEQKLRWKRRAMQ